VDEVAIEADIVLAPTNSTQFLSALWSFEGIGAQTARYLRSKMSVQRVVDRPEQQAFVAYELQTSDVSSEAPPFSQIWTWSFRRRESVVESSSCPEAGLIFPP
jgi:hypothetical protein